MVELVCTTTEEEEGPPPPVESSILSANPDPNAIARLLYDAEFGRLILLPILPLLMLVVLLLLLLIVGVSKPGGGGVRDVNEFVDVVVVEVVVT